LAISEDEVLSEKSQNKVPDVYTGTAEKTMQESAWVAKSINKPYNQDDLYTKTYDYSIYEEMLNDDQVSIAMQLKIDLLVGSGWDILATDKEQEEKAEEIYYILENEAESPLDEMLEELIKSAFGYGFAITEKVFKQGLKNKLALRKLKTTHPGSWLIHTDEYGNVTKYEQGGRKEKAEINPKSLIHYINNPQFQNPYGQSDLRKAYEAWFTKRHFVRMYSIFVEKAASPIPTGKFDRNKVSDEAAQRKLFDILKKFQTKTALVYPKDFEVEFLEAKNNGEAFLKGINLFNMFIGRSLFVPDLLGFAGSETAGGAYALGKEQMNLFFKHILKRRRTLERLVNKHIIEPLCIWNHGVSDKYPQFTLRPISDDNAVDFAKTFIEAIKGKLYKPTPEEINHFRSLIRFPESDDVEFFEEQVAGGVDPETGEPLDPKVDSKDPKAKAMDGAKGLKDEAASDKKKEFAKKIPEGYGHYHKRVDFKAIKLQLEGNEKTLVADLKPLVNKSYDDLLEQIQKKNILSNPDKIDRIDSLDIKYLGQLQTAFKKHFKRHYLDNKILARKELIKQEFAQPLPSDKFLAFLETETFDYIGNWKYESLKLVKRQLMNAVKDGKPLSEVIRDTEILLHEYSDTSIERYSRTKLTEVMNRARIEEFQESKIVAAYQFSAIMDDTTSDICSGLDGKIFKADDGPTPPMHFSCRSLLIPITIFEEFEADKKANNGQSIDKFIEENIGKGFSVK